LSVLNPVTGKLENYPKIDIRAITYGTYLDLNPAFERCTKKYFYRSCVRFNEGAVSFKCKTKIDGNDKETSSSQFCEI